MGERFATRASVVSRALGRRLLAPGLPDAPKEPKRILVAHHLLLGDTIMLSPLLAKLRANHPDARIAMTVPKAFAPLYAAKPWGVDALPFSPREAASARALFDEGPFDLAVVPGDNRQGWLAAAMGARHIVAHTGDRPASKSWLVDDERDYGGPGAWGDLVADLVGGREPEPFAKGDWPAPPAAPADRPRSPYAVLHVGAGSPLRLWEDGKWRELAQAFHQFALIGWKEVQELLRGGAGLARHAAAQHLGDLLGDLLVVGRGVAAPEEHLGAHEQAGPAAR